MAKRSTDKPAPGPATDASTPVSLPRPTLLSQIIGHEAAKRSLQAAMSGGRVHHAWIFRGQQGVGKFSTALAFGAALLDPTTQPDLAGQLAPDPESPVQRLIRAGNHPDLHVITKELARVTDDKAVREGKQTNIAKHVIDEFLLNPIGRTRVVPGASLAGKVFIVDEAELLDDRGQNTLLKTLEEPSPGSVIILVTSREDRLLPTIRSRCQRVAFAPLEESEIRRWLRQSGLQVAPEQFEWVVQYAAGRPGAAEQAVARGLYGWHNTLEPMLASTLAGRFVLELGPAMTKLVDEQAAAVVDANPQASKDAANKAWARAMLAFVADRGAAEVRKLSKKTGGAESPSALRCLAAIDAVALAESQLQSNVNIGLLMDNLAAQMAVEPAIA